MSVQRIIILICGIIGCFAFLLPWLKVPLVGQIDGKDLENSWPGLALMAGIVLLSLSGNRARTSSKTSSTLIGLLGILSALFGLYKWYAYRNDINEMGDGNFVARAISGSVDIRYGLILFICCGIVSALAVRLK